MIMQRRRLHCLLSLLLVVVNGGLSSDVVVVSASPWSDAAALLAFKAAADSRGRLSFSPNSTHCIWPGVTCSADGRVVRLLLDSAGLAGTFPNGTLGRLDQLRLLSLRRNALAGPLPADLSRLTTLDSLFLDGNIFAGPFPSAVLSLKGLRYLGLSHNRLSGKIPPALADLDGLISLRLQANRFDGPLPAFSQSSLRDFNVSENNLSGAVPVTAVLALFDPSAFVGNPGLCGAIVRMECSSTPFFPGGGNGSSPPAPAPIVAEAARQAASSPLPVSTPLAPASSHAKTAAAVAFLAGSIALIGILAVSLAIKKRRRRMRLHQEAELLTSTKDPSNSAASATEINVESYSEEIENMSRELEAAAAMATAVSEERVRKMGKTGSLVFCAGEAPACTLEQLMRASAEMLGRGSLGSTYKAALSGGKLAVTVKRLDKRKLAAASKDLFERHMDNVGRLRHPNLVPLRAYFRADEERMLVYDYLPNGSLHSLIHGSRSTKAKPLHWTSCLKIADDVVQGLAYIHQASHLVHGNIKSSNVLLGSDFEARLTDNCLSFLLELSDNQNASGYRAPETRVSDQQLTPSSDIYAFGVLLLELLTGKPPVHHPVLIPSDLLVWVHSVRDDGASNEHLEMIIDIAAACLHSSPKCRPTAWQVLKMIQEVKELDLGDNNDSTSLS
ncbi:putative inactive receptor kinase At5g67200 [Curcuma longa]|uniref:putative inactive receptor kinase At5g67200 n=1 Tax=Curcuma longa TaxID=136217 RepID=UPI003D9DC17C